jgi:hypothetical protein
MAEVVPTHTSASFSKELALRPRGDKTRKATGYFALVHSKWLVSLGPDAERL